MHVKCVSVRLHAFAYIRMLMFVLHRFAWRIRIRTRIRIRIRICLRTCILFHKIGPVDKLIIALRAFNNLLILCNICIIFVYFKQFQPVRTYVRIFTNKMRICIPYPAGYRQGAGWYAHTILAL